VTKLYDGGCDLLYAAQQVRAAASDRDATPALAATDGCIDAALANALRVAQAACDLARERTAPILAHLSLT
jgi:hypothetical protein